MGRDVSWMCRDVRAFGAFAALGRPVSAAWAVPTHCRNFAGSRPWAAGGGAHRTTGDDAVGDGNAFRRTIIVCCTGLRGSRQTMSV
jgi:hypothetical protein